MVDTSKLRFEVNTGRLCGDYLKETTNPTGRDSHLSALTTKNVRTRIFTSILKECQVKSDPESVSIAPGIFQVRIPKSCEVRATVVGDKVFAVRLDSQAREDTSLDWRRNQHELSYTPYEPPANIRDLLLAMNRKLGLFYAAYDLIVTPSEQYVFLEVNSLGQWLWLENAAGIPISQTLAELLFG